VREITTLRSRVFASINHTTFAALSAEGGSSGRNGTEALTARVSESLDSDAEGDKYGARWTLPRCAVGELQFPEAASAT